MALPESEGHRVSESPEVIERYNILKCLGKKIFSGSNVAMTGRVSLSDVSLAREFLARGAKETNPIVWASFFDHTIVASEVGRLVAEQAAAVSLEVDPRKVEFALWLHDISRIVSVDYLRNDFIGNRLLFEVGVPRMVFDGCLSSTYDLMKAAVELELTDGQIKLEEELDEQQVAIVNKYFNSLTPMQRITNLADNLGKRDRNGLFTLEAFRQYLKSQERRYNQTSQWPSVNWAISSPIPDKRVPLEDLMGPPCNITRLRKQ